MYIWDDIAKMAYPTMAYLRKYWTHLYKILIFGRRTGA